MSVTAIGNEMPTETIESKEIYRGFIAARLAACSTVGSIGLSHPRQEKRKVFGHFILRQTQITPSNCGDRITLREVRCRAACPQVRLARCFPAIR